MPYNCKNGKKTKNEIHCPVSGCVYSVGSERYFSEKKLLNQHIAKVHAEKKYSCAKCKKSFGLDWWRKHHEKTCGIEWKCTCGGKYTSRESLQTHVRRTQHQLPEHLFSSEKFKQNKMDMKSPENPVIFLIQPIIQNLTCIQPLQTSVANPRPILPKIPQPVVFTLPVSMNVHPNVPNAVKAAMTVQATPDNFNADQSVAVTTGQLLSPSNQFLQTPSNLTDKKYENNQELQKTIGTQTLDESYCSFRSRQSRASQCSRRKPKTSELAIESTHTQTAESTVIRIKKKRSRRKSVAITTEPGMLLDQNTDLEQSLWPGIKDFIFQHADNFGVRSIKNSASTQTNDQCKTLCDSETITEEELLKLELESSIEQKNVRESGNSPFEILSNIVAHDALVNLPENMDQNLSDLNMFTNNAIIDNSFPNENQNCDKETIFQVASVEKQMENPDCSVFSMFDNCPKPDMENKVSPPTLSDIHTQTIDSEVFEYNLLANMETQTTDDFIFPDLEFSDIETQTPWEDFPNIDDSPLPTDQLSIEIQTDFPSAFSQDPYEFINGIDVQNIINGCSNKESFAVNTETQTQDKFSFPQVTNTESQTLDIPNFMFGSLNS